MGPDDNRNHLAPAGEAMNEELNEKTRPAVSGSMALHCRQEIWLSAHGYAKEDAQPGANRTFDLGHMVEAAMFQSAKFISVDDDGNLEERIIGPWWDKNNPGYVGEIRDNKTGKTIQADMSQLSGFQRVVSFMGYKGHIDCLLKLDTGTYVADCKTTQGFGYDRALTNDLLTDVFAREYVGQLHFYMAGLRAEGEDITGAVLIYFNKEQSKVMARFVDYDESIVTELKERLSWAKNEAEPVPDWEWIKGTAIPLRCGYCSFRQSCAQVRGLNLTQQFDKKNKPQWIVS